MNKVRLCGDVPQTNPERLAMWRERYKAAGHEHFFTCHWARATHGVNWDCRQLPRQFQLVEGGPHYVIERGRISLNEANAGFLPIKEKHDERSH